VGLAMQLDGKTTVGTRAVRVNRCEGETGKGAAKSGVKRSAPGEAGAADKNETKLSGAARRHGEKAEKKPRWKDSGKAHKEGESRATKRSKVVKEV
jgi:hypothetical protein